MSICFRSNTIQPPNQKMLVLKQLAQKTCYAFSTRAKTKPLRSVLMHMMLTHWKFSLTTFAIFYVPVDVKGAHFSGHHADEYVKLVCFFLSFFGEN